jgi:AcrR family transcriptional regulator
MSTATVGPGRPEAGLRERKKQRTREALIEAAFALFARNGFEATTIDEIAEAVEVSPRTFFRYFATKEDVVLLTIEESIRAMYREFAARPAAEPVVTALRHAIVAVTRAAEQGEGGLDAERFACVHELTKANPALTARTMEHTTAKLDGLAGQIAARMGVDGTADLRPRLVAATVMCLLPAVINMWSPAEPDTPVSALIDRALRLLEEGINYPAAPR